MVNGYSILASSGHLESLSKQLEDNPRVRLLKYIAEHQPVSVKQIKTDLGMSVGSIYHHLSGLGKLQSLSRKGRYDEGAYRELHKPR